MFTVSVRKCFWALHRLVGAGGRLEPLHGHNWTVTAEVAAPQLDDAGTVMDFSVLEAVLEDILAGLENTGLDQLDCFSRRGCSAEQLAAYLHGKIASRIPKGIDLVRVRVAEAQGFEAAFAAGTRF